jgi:hypothetical protein
MTDKIGVLGETTSAVLGTATAYTCPAAKAAKCKIMFVGQGNAGAGTTLDILINGMTVAKVAAMTASYYVFSIAGAGVRVAEQAAYPTGIGAGLTVAPADAVYYLNAGDTVQYTIGGAAMISMNFQVVGAEIDV